MASFSQNPQFDDTVKLDNHEIELNVSKGKEIIIIPNIIGLDYPAAVNYLNSLGLEVLIYKKPPSDLISEPGKIIECDPLPGNSIEEGGLVKIFITSSEVLIEVPDFINLEINQAEQLLSSLGLGFEISFSEVDYAVQEGTVLGQIPEAGRFISPGEKVILFIGK